MRFLATLLLFLPALLFPVTLDLIHGSIASETLLKIKNIPPDGELAFIGFDSTSRLMERGALEAEGLHLLGYVSDGAYLALLSQQSQLLLDEGIVAWARRVPPKLKISPRVRGREPVAVRLTSPGNYPALLDVIFLNGTERTFAVSGDKSALLKLARSPGVLWIEPLPKWTLRNDISSWVVQSDIPYVYSLHNHGLTGDGEIIGHIDGDILPHSCYFDDPDNPYGPGHRKFAGYHSTGTDPGDAHGTHTAGTIAGYAEDESNNGIAYNARLTHTNIYDIFPFGATPLIDAFLTSQSDGAYIHSNSWGDDATTDYTQWCADIDTFTHENEENLVIFSVTNGIFLKSPENAKNALAVGGTASYPAEDTICRGGMGPTSDGRIKPEIFAPGCGIRSASSLSVCDTLTMSGTSMASPAIAASAAFIREYFQKGYYPFGRPGDSSITPSGSLLKAVLLSSTRDMPVPEGYPNMEEGWGYMVLDDTLYFQGEKRRLFLSDIRHESGLSEQMTHTYTLKVLSSSEPLRVVTVWADEPALPFSSTVVINNLDLKVTAPDGIYLGNNMNDNGSRRNGMADPLNNVEQVIISTPEAGIYTIDIQGAAVPMPSQGYALVVTGDIEVESRHTFTGITHKGGALGTQWASDLVLANFGENPESTTITFKSAGYGQRSAPFDVTIDPGETTYLDDLALRFSEEDTFGYIMFNSSSEMKHAVRTFNQLESGQVGQQILPAGMNLSKDQTAYLPGLYQDSHRRTNFGMVNLGSGEALVELELISEAGEILGTEQTALPHSIYVQESFYEHFENISFENATLKATVLSGDNVELYASVITSGTGDAVYLPAMKPHLSGFFPVIASGPGAKESLWRTELVLFNPLEDLQEIQLHAHLLVEGTWQLFQAQVEIEPNHSLHYADTIFQLFNLEAAFGYLEVSGTVVAAGRIYENEEIDNSVGQYTPLTVGPEVPAWQLVSFPGEDRRTNIGIVNRSSAPRYCAIKPLGTANQEIVAIPANGVGQWRVEELFDEPGSAWRIDCDGPVYLYASSVDNITQDAVFITAFVKDGPGFRW